MHPYERPSSWSETGSEEEEKYHIPENEQVYMEKLERAKEKAFQLLQEWIRAEKRPHFLQKIGGATLGHSKEEYGLENTAFEEKKLADLTYKELKEICCKNADAYKDTVGEDTHELFLRRGLENARNEFTEVLEFLDLVLAPLVLIHGVDGSIRQEQAEKFAELVKEGGVASMLESVFEMAEVAQYYMPDNVLKVSHGYADKSYSRHRTEEGDGPLYTVELELKLGENGKIKISGDEDHSLSGVWASVK